jgi:hypothetical protein
MKPWWVSELSVTAEEYDKVTTAAMDEFDEQCSSIDWVIYTARKPLLSATTDEFITKATATTSSVTANTEELPIAS